MIIISHDQQVTASQTKCRGAGGWLRHRLGYQSDHNCLDSAPSSRVVHLVLRPVPSPATVSYFPARRGVPANATVKFLPWRSNTSSQLHHLPLTKPFIVVWCGALSPTRVLGLSGQRLKVGPMADKSAAPANLPRRRSVKSRVRSGCITCESDMLSVLLAG